MANFEKNNIKGSFTELRERHKVRYNDFCFLFKEDSRFLTEIDEGMEKLLHYVNDYKSIEKRNEKLP